MSCFWQPGRHATSRWLSVTIHKISISKLKSINQSGVESGAHHIIILCVRAYAEEGGFDWVPG